MARKPASGDIEAMLREAVADPARAALLVQVSYLVQEADYARALRRLVSLTPEQCREAADWLAARFPEEDPGESAGPKKVH